MEARPQGLRIGFKTAPIRVAWRDLDTFWNAAGHVGGFDSAWLYDHLYPNDGDGSCLEGWIALTALAPRVPGARVGLLVSANPYRHPALVAKMAATLDHVTDGRLILGMGAGWHVPETAAMGMDLDPIGRRLADLRSAVLVIRALFTEDAGAWDPDGRSDAHGGVTLDAPPYRLKHARNDPLPVQGSRLPIWLGTQGDQVGLPMAGELADGWNFNGVGGLDEFVRKRARVLEAADGAGRPRHAIEVSAQIKVDPDDPAEGWQRCARFVEAGCDHVILYLDPRMGPGGLARVVEGVVRPLRDRFN